MTYCSRDVEASLYVYQSLWPKFRKHFPSPVTFAGMLEMSSAYLPVNKNWSRYVQVSDQTYNDTEVIKLTNCTMIYPDSWPAVSEWLSTNDRL